MHKSSSDDLMSAPTLDDHLQILPEIKDHIIICGLRNLGYRILEQVLQANIPVVVIDNQPELRFAEEVSQKKVPLLRRDSRSETVLLLAGILRARAIVTVADDDLKNLETVLEASRLAPGVRAVASFANSLIGEQIIKTLPNAHALSLPELTSITFITSSLPNPVLHLFEIGHEEVAVVQDQPNQAGSIRQLYGKIIPIQLEGAANSDRVAGKVLIGPSPNTPVQPSDTLFLIGRVHDLVAASEVQLDQAAIAQRRRKKQPHPAKRKRKQGNSIRQLRRFLNRVFRDILRDRPFRWALTMFVVILLASVLVLLFGRGDSIADSLYFALNIVIGQNIFDRGATAPFLMLFGFLGGIVGIVLLSIVNAYITNYIVANRIAQALGQQKAIDMSHHVVLTGLGGVGYQVLRGLREHGEHVVVIERDENNRYNNLARSLGVPVIYADARLPESLELANISKARCIAITTNDDMVNLETALTARQKNPQLKVVVRLFDRGLAEQIENRFHIHTARSSSALAAPYFVASALNYEVITSFYVHQTTFIVTRLVIKSGSPLDGLTVKQLYSRTGIMVMAHYHPPEVVPQQAAHIIPPAENIVVRQLAPEFYPDPEQFVLHGGATIYFVGPYDRITAVYKLNV
jgi:voltage-gated potassium channel Kch